MNKENITAFVTGGTGLLGAQLISDLLQTGRKIIALKRGESQINLVKEANHVNLSWHEGDITDIYSVIDGMHGTDEVYHCAAAVKFDTRKTQHIYNVNVEGTANVVNAALELGIEKFCHVSSVAALGRPDSGEILTEDHLNDADKDSTYAITKFLSEKEVWRGIAEGLNAVIVNPVIIIGPGDWTDDSSRFVSLVADGLKFFTRGKIAIIDVKDVSAIMLRLMDENIFGERFILSGGNYTYQEYFKLIADCLGVDAPDFELRKWMLEVGWRADAVKAFLFNEQHIITKEIADALFKNYTVSNQKIKKRLNYNFITLKESIENVCKKYLKEEIQLF